MSTSPAPTETINDLRAAVRGPVITADDPGYDAARAGRAGRHRPPSAAIVRVADADDIAQVLRVARETGLPLAVRSGGHSGAGHSVVDDGIVIDLRDLDELEIDVEGRTAWAGSGLTAVEYTTKRRRARSRDRVRRHRLGRPRRDHARRRHRLPRARLRHDHRLAARRGHRDGGRGAAARRRAHQSRPLLGDPRRRRQLRRRDAVPAAGCTRSSRSSAACWSCPRRLRRSPGSSRPPRPRPRRCPRSPTSCPARRCRSSRPSSTGRS